MANPFIIPYKSQLSPQEMSRITALQPKIHDYLQSAKNNGIPLDLLRLLLKQDLLPATKHGWTEVGVKLTQAKGNMLLVFLSIHTGLPIKELVTAIKENRLGKESIEAMAYMKTLKQ